MSSLVDPSCREHVILLYDSDDERNEVAINYINEGIRKGQLAVYASVNASDKMFMSKISSKIVGYDDNVNNGNLLILSLKPFYERALNGDLEPFKDFKALLEEIVNERIAAGKSGEVIVVADCADNLSRNEKFDECVYVERWWQETHLEWQKNNQKITVICPHPNSVLNKHSHKERISRQHSLTITALAR
ncbi:MEDS domain-containing protein [Candidatus Nitrososphaera gargensis]|nr:MEDS domain-containing protein [Candidatus Nitrososphaera gargensis]